MIWGSRSLKCLKLFWRWNSPIASRSLRRLALLKQHVRSERCFGRKATTPGATCPFSAALFCTFAACQTRALFPCSHQYGTNWQSWQFSEGLMSIDCTLPTSFTRYPACMTCGFSEQQGLKERTHNHADQVNDCGTAHYYCAGIWKPCSTLCFSDVCKVIGENWWCTPLPPHPSSQLLPQPPPSTLPLFTVAQKYISESLLHNYSQEPSLAIAAMLKIVSQQKWHCFV